MKLASTEVRSAICPSHFVRASDVTQIRTGQLRKTSSHSACTWKGVPFSSSYYLEREAYGQGGSGRRHAHQISVEVRAARGSTVSAACVSFGLVSSRVSSNFSVGWKPPPSSIQCVPAGTCSPS